MKRPSPVRPPDETAAPRPGPRALAGIPLSPSWGTGATPRSNAEMVFTWRSPPPPSTGSTDPGRARYFAGMAMGCFVLAVGLLITTLS